MNRYPVPARLVRGVGTLGKPEAPATDDLWSEITHVFRELLGVKPAEAFVAPSVPEIIDDVGGFVRDYGPAIARGIVRTTPWLARFNPYLRLLEALWQAYQLYRMVPGQVSGKMSPAGWECVAACSTAARVWGEGGLMLPTFGGPGDGQTCTQKPWQDGTWWDYQIGYPKDLRPTGGLGCLWAAPSWHGIDGGTGLGYTAFLSRSVWRHGNGPVYNYVKPAPEAFAPTAPTTFDPMPQVDPWSSPAPGTEQEVTPRPAPWGFVPELPDYAPDGTPVRGPARPRRVRPAPVRPQTKPGRYPRRRRKNAPDPYKRNIPKWRQPAQPVYDPWFPADPSDIPVVSWPDGTPVEVPGISLPGDDSLPGPVLIPVPGPAPSPSGVGDGVVPAVPSTSVEFARGRQPTVKETTHYYRKAPKHTREKKTVWKHRGTVLGVVNPWTEFCDIVDALYKALPKELRWEHKKSFWQRGLRTPRCQDKAVFVWAHTDQLDAAKAIEGLIDNEIKDRIFGTLSQGQAKSASELGRAPALPGFGVRGVFGALGL